MEEQVGPKQEEKGKEKKLEKKRIQKFRYPFPLLFKDSGEDKEP